MQGDPLLDVVGLGCRVSTRWLLRNVTFSIRSGELVGLVGANGAGKTTLLRAIAGFRQADHGTVQVAGREIHQMSSRERARLLASLPQLAGEGAGLTALETVLLGRHPHLGRFAAEGERDKAIVRLAMQSTGTSHLAERQVETLSGGERQRLLTARALAQEPRLLLLDEPTANLDLKHQIEIFDLVKRLASGGLAILAAIHDLRLAARYCDRLIVLSAHTILADGPPTVVLRPDVLREAFEVRAFVQTDPLTGALDIAGVTAAGPSRPPAGRVHVIAGGGRGAPAIARLAAAGFQISTGVLGEGDTDLQAARLAGAETIVNAAFAPISPDQDARHRALISSSGCVVLPDICWGANNLPNLRAAMTAGAIVVIDGEPIGSRDFSDGEASTLLASIADRAHIASLENLADIVGALTSVEVSS